MSADLFRLAISAIVVLLLGPVRPTSAQPSIVSRTVVSMGGINYPVNETSVAAYSDKLVAMWNVMAWNGSSFPHHRVAYAVSEDGGESWTDMGFLPRPDGCSSEQLDPTVAADPLGEFAGDFIGGAVIKCSGFSPVRGQVARMPETETEFDEVIALSNGSQTCSTDYTQLAVGPDPSGPQGATHLYMTCFTVGNDIGCTNPESLALFRSVDAGETWSSRTFVEVNNTILSLVASPWPVVTSDGTLYIAYNHRISESAREIEVVANANAGSGQFTNLALNHSRISFTFPNNGKMYGNYIPGDFRVLHGIQMASDPTDPNVLYIVYHDFDEAPQDPGDDADVDVYLIRGEYNSQSEEWEWSERIRINDDDPDVEQDQFFPTIVVDDYGDLHIAWFDTRNDPQGPDDDVLISLYYAFSDDGGQTFTNYEVDEVAIDTFLLQEPDFIGDYIRITMSGDVAVIVSNATGPLPGPFFPLTYVEQIHSARIEWE